LKLLVAEHKSEQDCMDDTEQMNLFIDRVLQQEGNQFHSLTNCLFIPQSQYVNNNIKYFCSLEELRTFRQKSSNWPESLDTFQYKKMDHTLMSIDNKISIKSIYSSDIALCPKPWTDNN